MAQTVEVPGLGPVQFPDGMSDADIGAAIRKTLAPKPAPMEASAADKIAAFPVTRFAIGAAKPILGAGQMLANALPFQGPKDYANDTLATLEEMTQRGSKTKWGTGGDVADFAGQVLSPVNMGAAKLLPVAGPVAAQAGKGAVLGAAGAATAPVMDRKGQENYWETKGADTALGAVTGGVATPLLGKLGEAIVRRMPKSPVDMSRASMQTDQVLRDALKELGQTIEDIPKAQYQQIRTEVLKAMKNGKQMDAAAMMRKADFKELGMPELAGQITRDATQFAKERNIRGVAGVGEPIMQRLEVQNQKLQDAIGGYAKGASDKVTAGERMGAALSGLDASLKGRVNQAYSGARDSVGRAAPMDAQHFSSAANLALDEGMLGHYLPAEVRNILNGVAGGKIPFNVNTAVQMDSVLSAAQRSAGHGSPQALAISKVRDALNGAPIENDLGVATKQAFDAARGMARERFALHEAVPALKAAAEGSVPADSFVRKFVINAPTAEAKKLADTLSKSSPDALREARTQIGAVLQKAAFGENVAGDKIFSPERYAKALESLGDKKLAAFFSQGEIEQMKRLSRVGAYINSVPSAAPVSSSNSNIASMVANYGAKLPGVGPAISVAKAAAGPILNQRTVNTAVNAKVPVQNAPLSPERAKALARLLGVGAVGGGLAVAQP